MEVQERAERFAFFMARRQPQGPQGNAVGRTCRVRLRIAKLGFFNDFIDANASRRRPSGRVKQHGPAVLR